MTYFVELDIDGDYPPGELLKSCQRLQVSVQLVSDFGPAGGNPIYRFHSNDKSELIRMLTKFDMTEYQSNIKFNL
jgi:hypothetical protein